MREAEGCVMRSFMIYKPHQALVGDQTKKNEKGGTCSNFEERRGAYKYLAGKPEGKRPLGRYRCRWGIILKLIFKK
jgi:hypothetical protein